MIEVQVLHGPDFREGTRKPNWTFLNPHYIVQVIPMSEMKSDPIAHKADEKIVFFSSIQMHDGTLFFCTENADKVIAKIQGR